MSLKKQSIAPIATIAFALIILAIAIPASGSEFQRHISLDGEELLLTNLIGEIHLEGAQGSAFEVEIQVRGKDASEDLIRIETEEGHRASVQIRFPTDEECDYVYPEMGRGSNTTFSPRERGEESSIWKRLFGWGKGACRRIHVAGRGRGLQVWADVTIKVPRESSVCVYHGVGAIVAKQIEGNLDLDSCSGPISAHGIDGDLAVDTGSGGVDVCQVTGDVKIDTGSGSVEVADCSGATISVDTGSGSVKGDRIDCRQLDIDTGSGSVRARAIRADGARIDTGSGSVRLELERMGDGRFEVDTGSGSIDLRLPPEVSARISADTGSGTITANVEDIHIRKSDDVSFRIGDGDTYVRLDTGSGSIHITQ